MEYKVEGLDAVDSKDTMSLFIDQFRVLASNNRNNKHILDIISKAIEKCNQLDDQKSLVNLYEIKISQIEHLKENHQDINQLIQEMKEISKKIDYMGGLALAYYKEWYIEKFKGEKERSIRALDKSMDYVSQYLNSEEYEYNVCRYSFAVESWLENHDIRSLKLLEESSIYFHKNGFYRSLAQTLSVLSLIYQITQNNKKAIELSKSILENRNLLLNVPQDTRGIIYYLAGVGQLLQANLSNSELFLKESREILSKHKQSSPYYNYYFIRNLLHIATIKGLKGEFQISFELLKTIEQIAKNEKIKLNFDKHSEKQVPHTMNLIKFYIYSRSRNFNIEEMKELTEDIFTGCRSLYSNFILLSEFILNANLKTAKLEELLITENFSVNRVKHIISFELLKRKGEKLNNYELQRRIKLLSSREKTSKTTFIENVFSDLLIAQQLFSLERFGEIYFLLRKYENQLHRIEVLELRIFMEAFIQVGAYKNGDPLGPALQYMAIKKCQEYGFSRLENKLLDYLFLQGSTALKIKG